MRPSFSTGNALTLRASVQSEHHSVLGRVGRDNLPDRANLADQVLSLLLQRRDFPSVGPTSSSKDSRTAQKRDQQNGS
jgi:hypothetical protein